MTTTPPRPHGSDYDVAYTTFVHLADHAEETFDLDNRITLAEAFEEFTRQGLDQVDALFPTDLLNPSDPDDPDDPDDDAANNSGQPAGATDLIGDLDRRLTRLLADSTGLTEALRYTRTLDLIRTLRVAPGVAIAGPPAVPSPAGPVTP